MAIVEELVLEVKAPTIKGLREDLAAARKAMSEAVIGSEEYKRASEDAAEAQRKLANATKLGTVEIEESDQSYNALSRTLSELKKQYHAAQTAAERAAIAEKIRPIDDQLKSLDKQVGVFGRNVGNYAGGVIEAFSSMGGAAGGVIAPIKGVTAGFQVLSKTPVIGILSLLINIVMAVVGAMKKSEEGTAALNKVFDAFTVVSDLMTKGLQYLGKGFAWVADGVVNLLEKMGILGKESEKRVDLGQREIELEQERRRVTMENADIEQEIAKKRAEASDKLNRTGQQSIALTKEAMALEEKRMQNNLQLRKMEYELIKEKNALLPSSSQEMQEEADAYAAMVAAETELFNKQREYNAQLFEMTNRAKNEMQALKSEAQDVTELITLPMGEVIIAIQKAREEMVKTLNKAYLDAEASMGEFDKEFAKDVEHLAKIQEQEKKKDDELAKSRKQNLQGSLQLASSIGGMLQTIADEDSEHGKKLAIAGSTIDTLSGAISAYMNAQATGLPPWLSIPLGITSAATVLAAGMANIQQIKSTDARGGSATLGAGIRTSAPAIIQQVPVTRTLTGAKEEATLNAIMNNTSQTANSASSPMRAYVVLSDLEGKQKYANQTASEASF